MWRSSEEDLEKALAHFRNYLKVRGFELSQSAALNLREYVMKEERKKGILAELSKKERTVEDLVEGFSKLAALSSEIALSEGRRSINSQDVDRAIKRAFCKIFPFCK